MDNRLQLALNQETTIQSVTEIKAHTAATLSTNEARNACKLSYLLQTVIYFTNLHILIKLLVFKRG